MYFQFQQYFYNLPTSLVLLLCLFTFHAFSLASSSFVEEEHQTWYYFFNTFCILLFISDIKCAFTTQIKPKWRRKLLIWMFFFLSHTLARRLNQTGDKWINLPDLGDLLIKEENKVLMSFFVIFGLVTVFYSLYNDESWSNFKSLSCILCLTSIYAYRSTTGFFSFPLDPRHADACLVIFWIGISLILILSVISRTTTRAETLVLFTVLISSLIHKPYNIFLNGLCVLSCNFVTDKIIATVNIMNRKNISCLVTILAHFCIGKVFYFYQVGQVYVFSWIQSMIKQCFCFFRGIQIAWQQSIWMQVTWAFKTFHS